MTTDLKALVDALSDYLSVCDDIPHGQKMVHVLRTLADADKSMLAVGWESFRTGELYATADLSDDPSEWARLVVRQSDAQAAILAATERAEKAERTAAEWQSNFAVLQHALVGNTGASGIETARALRERAEKAEALAAFGAWCTQEFRESMSDVDGGSAQDAMERFGVIEKWTATEPCGEACTCAEVTDFPSECYRFAPGIRAAIDQHLGAAK